MTGATLYAKKGTSMWVVKSRHTGYDLKDYLSKSQINWNDNPENPLIGYLKYHIGPIYRGCDLWCTRNFIVSGMDHIWNNSKTTKENISLFKEGHYILKNGTIEDDYNCEYEDYVYLLDFDNKKVLNVRELC